MLKKNLLPFLREVKLRAAPTRGRQKIMELLERRIIPSIRIIQHMEQRGYGQFKHTKSISDVFIRKFSCILNVCITIKERMERKLLLLASFWFLEQVVFISQKCTAKCQHQMDHWSKVSERLKKKKILSKVNETLGSFVQLTKYHIRPNITTSERMNVINTSTWPRGV